MTDDAQVLVRGCSNVAPLRPMFSAGTRISLDIRSPPSMLLQSIRSVSASSLLRNRRLPAKFQRCRLKSANRRTPIALAFRGDTRYDTASLSHRQRGPVRWHAKWHFGEVAEWLKALVSKTGRRATASWVRIPPSPPHNQMTAPSGSRQNLELLAMNQQVHLSSLQKSSAQHNHATSPNDKQVG